MKGAEQRDTGWSYLSAVLFNAPKPPKSLSKKSGAFCNKDHSPAPRHRGCAHLLPAQTPGKIFQPGPFPKWEAFPSPCCPGVWCADYIPQLPQERSGLARERHNGIRRRGNKQPPPALLGILLFGYACELPSVCGRRHRPPSPRIPANPDPAPLGSPGGAESSSHPRGFVPKVGDA